MSTGQSNVSPIAVGLGEVLWDMLPGGKQLGGAPANFAYHAQQLGGRAAVVSAVGRDPLGDELIQRLRDVSLDTSHIAVDPVHPTGTVSVTLDAAGVPAYVIHEGVAWDYIPGGAELSALARRSDVVCFGTLAQRSPVSHKTIVDFLAATREGCLRVCDLNLRQEFYTATIIEKSIAMSNVLKLSEHELQVVAALLKLPRDEGEAVGALLERFSVPLVAVTRAERGSSLYTQDEASHHGGYPTDAIDTVGAGDAFTAAVAVGLLRGDTLDQINDAANRLASYVCSQTGAMPPVPPNLRPSASKG